MFFRGPAILMYGPEPDEDDDFLQDETDKIEQEYIKCSVNMLKSIALATFFGVVYMLRG